VEDLLTLSSLESAYVTLERAVFPVRGVAEKVVSGFTAMSKKKRIEVRNHIPPEMVVSADRERLEEVFTNLIDNALKFTPEGGSVSLQAEAGAGSCKVSVCDTGMGIPAKDIPRIFERFYRVDKARSRELGGTGLGLSIVKHIITLHGGTAGVESVEGSGSCFWFTLPR
jgi:two-component system, OmpR family, phosphate regulon sensor histidine kinase PhoR